MPHRKKGRNEAYAKAELSRQVATAGREELMEAMVAACALVAHADGEVDERERRRILQLMRAIPAFTGFTAEAVTEEFARHERAFSYEPFLAREKALTALETLRPHASEARLLLAACQHVLEADGKHHPSEYQALHEVGKALDVA